MKKYNNFKLNESNESEYTLGYNSINDIIIDDEIIDNDLFGYKIVELESEIDNLIDYISETDYGYNRNLMKKDLKMLMNIDYDKYIFSSVSTNDFITSKDKKFNETCEELLHLQENYKKDKKVKDFNL